MNTLLKWIEWNECVFSFDCGKNKDILNLMKNNHPFKYYRVMLLLDEDGFFDHELKVVK